MDPEALAGAPLFFVGMPLAAAAIEVFSMVPLPSLGLDGANARAAIELREDSRAREGIIVAGLVLLAETERAKAKGEAREREWKV